MFSTHSSSQELRALIEPSSPHPDAATTIVNLPDYRVTGSVILACGLRQINVEATAEASCPSCAVISTIPVADPVEVPWTKRRFFCDEYLCPRQTFTEESALPGTVHPPAPRRHRRHSHRIRTGRCGSSNRERRLVVAGPAGTRRCRAGPARC